MVYNYPITIDNLPLPTEDQCDVIKAIHGCYIHVEWHSDGSSEIHYQIDPPFPFDSVLTIIEQQKPFKKHKRFTQLSIGYSCRSNQIACNTIDRLKRAMISTHFPKNEPLPLFNRTSCLQLSNSSQCQKSNLETCQRCVGTVEYKDQMQICTTCSNEKTSSEFFNYSAIFLLRNQTRSERIHMECDQCPILTMVKHIRMTMNVDFRFNQFSHSIASNYQFNIINLLTIKACLLCVLINSF